MPFSSMPAPIQKYIEFLDVASLEDKVKSVLGSVNEYQMQVQQRGETQYCLEYPIIRSVLEKLNDA